MGFKFYIGEPLPAANAHNLPENPRTATKNTALATV
jgi:hypothetical protein